MQNISQLLQNSGQVHRPTTAESALNALANAIRDPQSYQWTPTPTNIETLEKLATQPEFFQAIQSKINGIKLETAMLNLVGPIPYGTWTSRNWQLGNKKLVIKFWKILTRFEFGREALLYNTGEWQREIWTQANFENGFAPKNAWRLGNAPPFVSKPNILQPLTKKEHAKILEAIWENRENEEQTPLWGLLQPGIKQNLRWMPPELIPALDGIQNLFEGTQEPPTKNCTTLSLATVITVLNTKAPNNLEHLESHINTNLLDRKGGRWQQPATPLKNLEWTPQALTGTENNTTAILLNLEAGRAAQINCGPPNHSQIQTLAWGLEQNLNIICVQVNSDNQHTFEEIIEHLKRKRRIEKQKRLGWALKLAFNNLKYKQVWKATQLDSTGQPAIDPKQRHLEKLLNSIQPDEWDTVQVAFRDQLKKLEARLLQTNKKEWPGHSILHLIRQYGHHINYPTHPEIIARML